MWLREDRSPHRMDFGRAPLSQHLFAFSAQGCHSAKSEKRFNLESEAEQNFQFQVSSLTRMVRTSAVSSERNLIMREIQKFARILKVRLMNYCWIQFSANL